MLRYVGSDCSAKGAGGVTHSDVSFEGLPVFFPWLPNRDPMPYSTCQIGPIVSYWFHSFPCPHHLEVPAACFLCGFSMESQRDYESPNVLLTVAENGNFVELKGLAINKVAPPPETPLAAAAPVLQLFDTARTLTRKGQASAFQCDARQCFFPPGTDAPGVYPLTPAMRHPSCRLQESVEGRHAGVRVCLSGQVRPYQLAVAAGDCFVRVYDRRMLSQSVHLPADTSPQPLLKLAPPHMTLAR
jgi:hypothetical protein